ncbi:MAG: hypothetical protein L3J61_01380, partial [Ghiorsea sp.]|nr:hypothetical protein [Ghiorsea sp.]
YVDSVACLNKQMHHHAKKGETIPDEVWREMYGEHVNIVAHDASCIGCMPSPQKQSSQEQHHHEHHHD